MKKQQHQTQSIVANWLYFKAHKTVSGYIYFNEIIVEKGNIQEQCQVRQNMHQASTCFKKSYTCRK